MITKIKGYSVLKLLDSRFRGNDSFFEIRRVHPAFVCMTSTEAQKKNLAFSEIKTFLLIISILIIIPYNNIRI